MTQEEILKEMMVMSPMTPIKIVSDIDIHPKTQTRVETVEEEDVEDATRDSSYDQQVGGAVT